MLMKGDRDEGLTPEQGLAKEQAAFIHGECTKGIFDGPKVNQLVDTIGDNSREQNQLLADVYERTYDVSLGKHLDKKCEAKLHLALKALLLPTPDFIAWRLERAMKGWLTDSSTLIVLLGGIDGLAIDSVAVAYERKYSRPLEKALRDELSGSSDFERAAVAWARAMQDPSGGLEGETEQEVGKIAADAGALGRMADALLLEHESLLRFISTLDTERLADACRGWGTDDTELIQCLTTRSKRRAPQPPQRAPCRVYRISCGGVSLQVPHARVDAVPAAARAQPRAARRQGDHRRRPRGARVRQPRQVRYTRHWSSPVLHRRIMMGLSTGTWCCPRCSRTCGCSTSRWTHRSSTPGRRRTCATRSSTSTRLLSSCARATRGACARPSASGRASTTRRSSTSWATSCRATCASSRSCCSRGAARSTRRRSRRARRTLHARTS